MTGQDWLEKDFYAVLGVSKTADATEIKKAYRKLARTLHPDHNPGDARSEARFKEVGEAYAVLSDPEQRQQYDQLRAMAGGARFTAGAGCGRRRRRELRGPVRRPVRRGRRCGPARCATSSREPADRPARASRTSSAGCSAAPAAVADRPGSRRAQPGVDLSATATLPFRQAVEGSTVTLAVEGQNLTVRIPPGVHDGQKIRMRGKGRPSPAGGPAGRPHRHRPRAAPPGVLPGRQRPAR